MSVIDGGDGGERQFLAQRVAWAPGPNGFAYAYAPGRLLVRGEATARHLDAVTERSNDFERLGDRDEAPDAAWLLAEGIDDPPAIAELIRADGLDAQPDHVFFAHGCDECCSGPHPALTFDALLADPWRANPWRANPWRANPWRANPWRANPWRANPWRANETQMSSALPATARSFPVRELNGPGAHPRITVLDTGLADGNQLPQLLNDPNRISGDPDAPDAAITTATGATVAADGWLDPVAGHGTFIAGLIEQLAPGCTVRVGQVISPLGDVRESDTVKAILAEAALPAADRPHILSLSFGGTALAGAPALRSAIAKARLAGIVIVASAGNEGSPEPHYPGGYDGVIAVGALGPDGPAPWSNYGEWVDACAPGVDLVSAFFAAFDGSEPRINTADPDAFAGWAEWSGTSFAAPVVVAALAREIVLGNCTAQQAVERLIHAPHALRVRCLGTVVTV